MKMFEGKVPYIVPFCILNPENIGIFRPLAYLDRLD